MNIYHLEVKDQDDNQFDVHYHFSHPTKSATDLWENYQVAYSKVIDNATDWTIVDVIKELEKMGWIKLEVESVEVFY